MSDEPSLPNPEDDPVVRNAVMDVKQCLAYYERKRAQQAARRARWDGFASLLNVATRDTPPANREQVKIGLAELRKAEGVK